MSTAVMTHQLELNSLTNTTLKAAARFWFVVTVIGQLTFAFTVASFYGLTALRGDFHGWSRFISRGWVRGDTTGNFAVAMHLGSAAVLMLAGVDRSQLARRRVVRAWRTYACARMRARARPGSQTTAFESFVVL